MNGGFEPAWVGGGHVSNIIPIIFDATLRK